MKPFRPFRANVFAIAISWLLSNQSIFTAEPDSRQLLPEGNTGIAAEYPGDADIESDARVIFVETFDHASVDAIVARWESTDNRSSMAISSDVPANSADERSLRIDHIGGRGTGGQLYRRLEPGQAQVFARFHVKFSEDCAPIHHFGTHLGGFNPSTPWPQGGAGTRPNGEKRFTTGVEPYGNKWQWDFYTYWQGMHVHGDGRYWGTPFLSGVNKPAVERGRWICVEMMVKLNTPTEESNGEQAFWIDGKLVRVNKQVASHIGPGFPQGKWLGGWWHPDNKATTAFEGFRWRTVEELKINYIWTYLYITRAPHGHHSKVWFDNIVVAEEYIGPIEPQS